MSGRLIEFGVMAAPLRVQLRGLRLPRKELNALDADGMALSRLTIRGLISESVRDAARKRILRRIEALSAPDGTSAATPKPETPLNASK